MMSLFHSVPSSSWRKVKFWNSPLFLAIISSPWKLKLTLAFSPGIISTMQELSTYAFMKSPWLFTLPCTILHCNALQVKDLRPDGFLVRLIHRCKSSRRERKLLIALPAWKFLFIMDSPIDKYAGQSGLWLNYSCQSQYCCPNRY